MRKFNTLAPKRNNLKPNERRRQTWRKHHMALIDQRSKWFYQQQGWSDNVAEPAVNTEQDVASQQEPAAEQEKSK